MPTNIAAKLDEQLAVMRRYGQDDVILVANTLAPEHKAWAEANGVETMENSHVAPWVCYLVNRSALDKTDVLFEEIA